MKHSYDDNKAQGEKKVSIKIPFLSFGGGKVKISLWEKFKKLRRKKK